jgi:hypothetical protein
MRFLFVLFCLFLAFPGFCQSTDSFINATEARRVLGILASDSLKGRGNFSKEQEKAALFIAKEFSNAGLQPFGGYTSYIDPFVYLDRPEPLERVVVNNRSLGVNEYFLISPFVFPPTVKLSRFQQKRFNDSISVEAIIDSLKVWQHIDQPMVLLLPQKRKDFFKKFAQGISFPFPEHVRLIVESPGLLEQLSIFMKPYLTKNMLFNVLGYLPGKSKPNELVLVTAHYDHVGYLKNNVGDSVFNGANDNASGTTSMMMLANYFAAKKDNERSLLFVAFAGEEIGLIGSQHLASVLNTDSIIAVVNLEMLGKRGENDRRSCIVTGTGSLPAFFRKTAKKHGINIRYDNNVKENLFARSDNYPFARRGVPAHTFMIWIDHDPDYHQLTDEIETLDLENMAEIVKGLTRGIEELASGRFTPKR